MNDEEAAGRVLSVAAEVLGHKRVATMPTPAMGAEDFSYVLQRVPGTMMFLGGGLSLADRRYRVGAPRPAAREKLVAAQ